MNFKYLTLSIFLAFIISCDNSNVYKEHKSINNDFNFDFVSWKKTDTLNYEIILDKVHKDLKPILSIRHAMHYPFSNIKLKLECLTPDGKLKNTTLDLVLAENNMFKGSGMGDLWDIDIPVSIPVKFNQKGKYNLIINQDMMEKLPGILEVGFILKKAEK